MAYKCVHIEKKKKEKKKFKHVLKQLLQMYFHIHVCFKKVYIFYKSFNLISIKNSETIKYPFYLHTFKTLLIINTLLIIIMFFGKNYNPILQPELKLFCHKKVKLSDILRYLLPLTISYDVCRANVYDLYNTF